MVLADGDSWRYIKATQDQRRARLLALAFHLSRVRGGDWGGFGSARIAIWLGVHRNTVDADVKRLESAGLLQARKDHNGKVVYSYRG
jgi:Mn-dependent DtxR family transcriptional regulator